MLVVIAIGCHTTTGVQHPSEPMPLPGETASHGDAEAPDFRIDPHEHPGRLSEDEIDSVLRLAHPEVTACYEQVLAVSPEVEGTANTIFIIGTDGAVVAAASSGIEPRLARCIDGVIARRVFPPPRGGTLKVRYLFTFQSATPSTSDVATTTTTTTLSSGAAPRARAARVTCGGRR